MDKEIFVQNIKNRCRALGVAPTVACKESGVGASFITNIKHKGQTPSVAKVQQLAAYLGCTTSELLGETSADGLLPPLCSSEFSREDIELVLAYHKADERARNMVDLALEPFKLPSQSGEAM